MNLGDIGDILKVRLSHDNSGDYPELLVSHLRMIRLPSVRGSIESGQLRGRLNSSASNHTLNGANFTDLTFYFNTWLSRNYGDGEVTREVASKASLGLMLREQRRVRLSASKRVNEELRLLDEEMEPLPS